ncbi:uncharacterized protein LOC106661502 isoform X2 [Cimex lectularius]|uniref:Uncharacterized protein n=1 Tax=Cimex lectularius TaxID=79782 RepID=A0A8I6R9U4_CIMLE|nr:uncharacterized protein LOC106661502 isoform X2 [Cimex lectularius]XP_014240444.1 uncharacterized protein LOC106661502 isoform X2 [Cimex lectularius]
MYKCSISVIKPCRNDNESCYQIDKSSNEGICKCMKNFTYVNNACVPHNEATTVLPQEVVSKLNYSSEGISGTLWVLIPCLSLAAMGVLVLLGKRYRVTERLYALRVRRYNTVFVSSANVDDDAPIT